MSEMENSQPRKCPYCESNDTRHMLYRWNSRYATEGVCVVCMKCVMRGPIGVSNADASRKFNSMSKN